MLIDICRFWDCVAYRDVSGLRTGDERKTTPQFQQEFLNVRRQSRFQFAFMEMVFHRQEVEHVGIFEQTGCQCGMNRRQAIVEVADGSPLPCVLKI